MARGAACAGQPPPPLHPPSAEETLCAAEDRLAPVVFDLLAAKRCRAVRCPK